MKHVLAITLLGFAISTSGFSQIPTDNLVLHFPFNGNANDQSGLGNHGAVFGASLTTDRFGNEQSAYLFDGFNDYIGFNSDPSTLLREDMTLSIWVRADGFPVQGQHYPIVFRGEWGETEATNQPYHFYTINLSGQSHFGMGHEFGNGSNAGGNLNSPVPGEWTHVAVLRDHIEKTYTFFINGALDSTLQYSSNPTGGEAGTGYLGWSPAAITQYFDGALDDIRLYQRVLTQDEILALWNEITEPPQLTCDSIDLFVAKCNSRGTAQAMVLLLNSTGFAGTTVEFQLDSTLYPVELITNGVHTTGRLSVRPAGFGQHTMSLVSPSACFEPIYIVCQVDANNGLNEGDLWDSYDHLFADEFADDSLKPSSYPNPFNPSTTLRFTLPSPDHVTVQIFDALGREVVTLVDGMIEAGTHETRWDGRNSSGNRGASGVYIYRIVTAKTTHSGTIMMLK